jgi:Na+/H+ antiporter NhaD/arsenite permease-like protein
MLSALFVTDLICLGLTPLVLEVTRQLRLPPVRYLIAPVTSNVGRGATPTGNPQNMLIGSFSGLAYRSLLPPEASVAPVGLALVLLVVRLAYRRPLAVTFHPAWLNIDFPVHHLLMAGRSWRSW